MISRGSLPWRNEALAEWSHGFLFYIRAKYALADFARQSYMNLYVTAEDYWQGSGFVPAGSL